MLNRLLSILKVMIFFLTLDAGFVVYSYAENSTREYSEYAWDLTLLFESPEQWEKEYQSVQTDFYGVFIPYMGQLQELSSLKECLDLREKLFRRVERCHLYAHLYYDANYNDIESQKRTVQADRLYEWQMNITSFITAELLYLPEERFRAVYESPELNQYKPYLREIGKRRERLLSPEKEKLIYETANIIHFSEDIYHELKFEDDQLFGENSLNYFVQENTLRDSLRNPDREKRKIIFRDYYRKFDLLKRTYTSLLNAEYHYRTWKASLRKYPDPLTEFYDNHDYPSNILDFFTGHTNTVLPVYHQMTGLTTEILDLHSIEMYDLYYKPIKFQEIRYTHKEAFEILSNSLVPINSNYIQSLNSLQNERRIFFTDKKRGNHSYSYEWDCYDSPSYVLIYFDQDLESLLSLAHETGHAIRHDISKTNNSYQTYHYDDFRSEIIPEIQELLVLNFLILIYKDKPEQQNIYISRLLEKFSVQFYQQMMVAQFQKQLFSRINLKGRWYAQELNLLWEGILKQYYGEKLIVGEGEITWANLDSLYQPYQPLNHLLAFYTAFIFFTEFAEGNNEAFYRLLYGGKDLTAFEQMQQLDINLTDEKHLIRFSEYLQELVLMYKENLNRISQQNNRHHSLTD